jgi:nicotinamidase-related amidase
VANEVKTINSAKTALLVMDFQPAVLASLPASDAVVDRVAGLVAASREVGVRIVYIRVGFSEADYAAVPESNVAFSQIAHHKAMSDDAPETSIDSRLSPDAGDLVIRKTRVGAFSTTDLGEQLRDADVDTVILAGVFCAGVVLSTYVEATDRDYRVYVVSDACADPNPVVHETLMVDVFPAQAEVLTAASLLGLLRV